MEQGGTQLPDDRRLNSVGRTDAVEQIRAIARDTLSELRQSVPADEAARFISSTDPHAFVGRRHHVVPRFLLNRWSDETDQVVVYSRVEQSFGKRNINDLAIKDFHTFIDTDGQLNSLLESLLGHVESAAAVVIDRLLSSLQGPAHADDGDLASLATFAAFQVARTPRRRREQQVQGEWYAKTKARGQVPDDQLRALTVVPHRNDIIRSIGAAAQEFAPLFFLRPLALVTLDRPLLLIGDDPVVINAPSDFVHHHADCFMTEEQIAERARRNRRRDRRRPISDRQGRKIHLWSPIPMGVGTAHELVLPTSPSSALVWGALGAPRPPEGIEHGRIIGQEADHFADLVNDATCERALDWVVASKTDTTFRLRTFPPQGPVVRVCDGENAASAAVNRPPSPIRPYRLDKRNPHNFR